MPPPPTPASYLAAVGFGLQPPAPLIFARVFLGEKGVEGLAAGRRGGVLRGAGRRPRGCREPLLRAYLNVPFQRALWVETAIFCLIVNLGEVTHRLLTHSLLL